MQIQHNMSAATADRNLKTNENKLKTAIERLSSGYRINAADDDAAGLTISEKLRWQIRGLERASKNIQDGISLTQVADGALNEVHSMLDRMKELAVQAANDTNTELDRASIQDEIDQIKSEVNRISTDTSFNDIRIFKPTNTPEITGSPTDILVFHEDYSGGVREGGIIYNGKRYAYEDMTNLEYDGNGNIKAGTYPVKVYAEDNMGDITPITIKLIFDGGDRIPSGREYELDPRNDGIYIDLIKHDWSEVRDANGKSLDPANVQGGTYSFKHAGLNISFKVEDGSDLGSVIESLKKDGLTTYMLRSSDVTEEQPLIIPSLEITPYSQPVTQNKQHLIPGDTVDNINAHPTAYQMYADENEIYMYLPAANRVDGVNQDYIFTRITWKDLGLTEWMRYQPGASPEWVNPDNNVSQGEQPKGYVYRDSITGITIPFTIDSEVSFKEVINGINDWEIRVDTTNEMIFKPTTTGGSATITMGSHSDSLDAYGTQFQMGRDMSGQMTLATNSPITETSGNLSYTMSDAGGTTYTFSSPNATDAVRNRVESSLRSYISQYRAALERQLSNAHAPSTPPALSAPSISTTTSDSVTFTATPGGYTMDLGFSQRLDNTCVTLNPADFGTPQWDNVSREWHLPTTPTTNDLINTLTANGTLKSVTDGIMDSLTSTTMSVQTDPGPVKTENHIFRDLTTTNKRYSSTVIPGDREVKIQAGCQKNQYIAIKLPPMNTALMRVGGVNVSDHAKASAGIGRIDYAIDFISDMRSGYGATQNRLEKARSINDTTAENSQAAESLIRDADMAEESMHFARHSILQQAGQSMLAQANHQPQAVFRLLS